MKVIDQIYNLRHKIIIIGLTGRTGSGCTTVAKVLATKDIASLKSEYKDFNSGHINNDVRKNRIIYYFIKENWKPFIVIKASDVIFYYALMQNFDCFSMGFSHYLDENNKTKKEKRNDVVIDDLKVLKGDFINLNKKIKNCEEYFKSKNNTGNDSLEEYKKTILEEVPRFRKKLENILSKNYKKDISKVLQSWGNNIRLYNSIIKNTEEIDDKAPSCLAYKINQFIDIIRLINEKNEESTLVVIDALRNPYEILYFRERSSAFYTMSVNTEEDIRKNKLFEKGLRIDEVEEIDKEETGKNNIQQSYERIDIDKCIELSDIHLTHQGEKIEENRDLINQIFTYVSLILHPGLVPPSPIERIMQIAYTAKLNSGCLSRQVGAAVTNEYFSIQSIGWNTVAEGQTPCTLRNLFDLYHQEDANAYSNHEKTDKNFISYIKSLSDKYLSLDYKEKLKGLTLPYCFKDIHTTINPKQKGNQVHTRSLHAEENSFLQLAKYGTSGIKGGKLFTTASCCELCAKKAYQLGISEIYYIDSYPGISRRHILECGDNQPKMILFNGAVGRAYINLYNPFIPLKDELEALTGVDVKNLGNLEKSQDEKKIMK